VEEVGRPADTDVDHDVHGAVRLREVRIDVEAERARRRRHRERPGGEAIGRGVEEVARPGRQGGREEQQDGQAEGPRAVAHQ
jgi:hypothetical protein